MRDAVAKGRMPSGDATIGRRHPEIMVHGESHYRAKLTEDDIVNIRKLYASGAFDQPALARKFGVAQSGISRIIHRKIWKRLAHGLELPLDGTAK